MPSSRDLPNPEIEPKFPALQADSLPSEPPGKTKKTGVGTPSFLQGIFPAQESNQGLLHCRQILYRLSQQRSSYPEGENNLCYYIWISNEILCLNKVYFLSHTMFGFLW